MLQIYKELELEIPSECSVKIDSRVITVKGPRGELTKVRKSKGRMEREGALLG